jgi:phosphate transport system substrate-binding protein
MNLIRKTALLITLGLLIAHGFAQDFAQADLTGAGASFPAPLIATWADEYRDLTDGRVVVNYQSIGSGGGIRQFLEQTIHFGATEAFLSDEQLQAARNATGGEAFNLPITLGDVVLTYNLPGVGTGLIFNAEVIAGLFLGEITSWNDARLQELNPGVQLPDTAVNIVHRADGSGTTNIFTNYLSKVSSDWAERVGFGTSVNWPAGMGASGNEGVSGIVSSTPGALGYNSLVYATLNDISYGYVINSSGNVIEPSLASTTSSAEVALPEDTRVIITNTQAPDGYPITGFSWALVYENLDANNAFTSREQAEELVRFLIWIITDGQEISEILDFARLPAAAVERNLERLGQIKWQGENIGLALVEEATE